MTQPAAAPPPPAVQPAPPQPAAAGQARAGFSPAPTGTPMGAGVEDTPGLLNRLQVLGIAAVLIFGLLSGLVQLLSYQSDGRAADDTEQLVRIQEIQSTLLSADAIATNLALSGGQRDPERERELNADYVGALVGVFELIAAAADAQAADEKALAALNVEVNDYATAIAAARANLRQGFPVGKEYLSGASASLRTDAIPILENLVTANSERAEDSMAGQHPFWLLLIGVAAIAVLVWLNTQLARRFHRYLNVGVAVAGAVVLLVTLVAVIAAWRGDNQNDDLLDTELSVALNQAEARTAGNDAKANESLRLVNRGSGAKYEDPWIAAAETVEDKADRSVRGKWESYRKAHEQIVRYDGEDRRGPAIQIATGGDKAPSDGNGDPYDSTAAFEEFDKEVAGLVAKNGATTTEELRAGRTIALVGSLLTIVLGFAAAVAVARGISARRKEFA